MMKGWYPRGLRHTGRRLRQKPTLPANMANLLPTAARGAGGCAAACSSSSVPRSPASWGPSPSAPRLRRVMFRNARAPERRQEACGSPRPSRTCAMRSAHRSQDAAQCRKYRHGVTRSVSGAARPRRGHHRDRGTVPALQLLTRAAAALRGVAAAGPFFLAIGSASGRAPIGGDTPMRLRAPVCVATATGRPKSRSDRERINSSTTPTTSPDFSREVRAALRSWQPRAASRQTQPGEVRSKARERRREA